jgi:beta-galactosidase
MFFFQFIDLPEGLAVPAKKPTMALPAINFKPVNTILSPLGRSLLGSRPIVSNQLLTFEQLNQFSGFVLYETELPKMTRDPSNLVLTTLRDRALIYVDGDFVGALSRENYINTLPISAGFGSKLSILVENQGRINFEIADDYKV